MMPRSQAVRTFLLMLMLFLFLASPAAHADEREAGKSIVGKCGDAIVEVKGTIKMRTSYGGNEQKDESELETMATVIDPSGMAVLSFSSIDPSRLLGGIIKRLKAAAKEGGPQIGIDTDVSGLVMVLADGREIPATIVMRDTDLDLAFIRPTDKLDKPISYVDISQAATADMLDPIFLLSRLDKNSGRTPYISMQHIEAVISTPRKFYITDNKALTKLGAPVFSMDGKVIGFSLIRIIKTSDRLGIANLFSNGMSALGMMPVILPVKDVFEAEKQAKAIKE